jgi:hypothetical protein
MRVYVRFWLLALLVGSIVAVSASAAQAAVEIEKFVGTNCKAAFEHCGEKTVGADIFGDPLQETVEPNLAESEEQGFRQAAGHAPFGVTDFMVKHAGDYTKGEAVPTGIVTHVRVDVAAGLAAAPAAVPQCSSKEFGEKEAIPGTGFYAAPTCKKGGPGPHEIGPESTVIGEEKATVYVAALAKKGAPPDIALAGTLYNLVQPTGRSALYGAALKLPQALTAGALKEAFEAKAAKGEPLGEPTEKFLEEQQYYAHTLVEGNVEWGQEAKGLSVGDYHDYFEVTVSPSLPVIRSRQINYGTAGNGAFITNGTRCPGNHTTNLTLEGVNIGTEAEVKARLEASAREVVRRPYETLLALNECQLAPFNPTFALNPSTTASDEPDGITTELGLTRFPEKEVDSSQLNTATVTLPEGMTLNPSAAAGLTACTPAQARIHSSTPGTSCPSSSVLGTVSLNVPTLPPGSFTGNIYLGGPESGPITGPPYTLYVDAESARYGVSVRLKGSTTPNLTTGRVTTSFTENPEQPFTNLALKFNGGALAPIANPLGCGTVTTQTSLTPFTGTPTQSPASSFVVDSNGKGGACASPLPFAPVQSTANQTANAGGHTSYTFNLTRNSGEQYLSQVYTVLPAGLVGAVPTVTQCTEAQAVSNTCPATSLIGSATAISGAGPAPFTFGNGAVYFTGPYNGAPYGLSIVVPAIAGPFNLGPVITRAKVEVDPGTSRVVVRSVLPTIVGGIPTRLRGINVAINKQGYLFNPTNCGLLATESLITSTFGATRSESSPFQVANCNLLSFKPSFKAKAGGKTSRENGASLETTINQPAGQANMKSVVVTLPKQLPSRQSTLKHACPEATFAANPYLCPRESFVGGARANTPTLPGKLQGPVIFVSHGGAAFPDLDLVLEANGVRVIVKGNTAIKNGITTTSFLTNPDVPVSSVTVNLPIGSHSALGAVGNLCTSALYEPTVITGQNGVQVTQKTRISIGGCGVQVVGAKAIGNNAYLTVKTFAAGRISGGGSSLGTVYRRLGSASNATSLKVPLSGNGQRRGRPFKTRVRVGFVPKKRGSSSVAFVTVTFR